MGNSGRIPRESMLQQSGAYQPSNQFVRLTEFLQFCLDIGALPHSSSSFPPPPHPPRRCHGVFPTCVYTTQHTCMTCSCCLLSRTGHSVSSPEKVMFEPVPSTPSLLPREGGGVRTRTLYTQSLTQRRRRCSNPYPLHSISYPEKEEMFEPVPSALSLFAGGGDVRTLTVYDQSLIQRRRGCSNPYPVYSVSSPEKEGVFEPVPSRAE